MEKHAEKHDIAFKFCIFGDSGVGKSTLVNRYITSKFELDLKSTLGAAILTKFIETETMRITLQIWDFGGEERFNFLLPSYAKGSSASVFMCDISNQGSIWNINKWLLAFNEGLNNQDPKFPFIVVGGKLDLEEHRSLNKKDIEAIPKVRKEFDYIECSAKTGENVDLLFQTIIDKMIVYAGFKGI